MSSETGAPPRQGSRGPLIAAIVVMVVVLGVLLYLLFPLPKPGPGTSTIPTGTVSTTSLGTGQIIDVPTFNAVVGGGVETVHYVGLTPVTLRISAKSDGVAPLRFVWNFGDGTNGTGSVVSHTYPPNCVFDIHLQVTDVTGRVTSRDLVLNSFLSDSWKLSGVVCPNPGTAGIGRTWIEQGGVSGTGGQVGVSVDGVSVGSQPVQAGFWYADLSNYLAPKTNGSTYLIVVTPTNKTRVFTTLEGIQATPSSGGSGSQVTVIGRSYNANTMVSVYLGGVYLGQSLTDANGSFSALFTIPTTSPLTRVGYYQFTTSPPVLGLGASFVVNRGTFNPSEPITGIPIWLIAAILVAVAVVAYLVVRRRRRKPQPPAPA